ncbi:hypothetical protein PAPHI01_2368 [Pancytospora philotis]|nr:hypothetical protein PAPHI01_2368 [Pancytospora philotis]
MDEEKAKHVLGLAAAIRDKTVLVRKSTQRLNMVNLKLRALLDAFSAYAVPHSEIAPPGREPAPERSRVKRIKAGPAEPADKENCPVQDHDTPQPQRIPDVSEVFTACRLHKAIALQIKALLSDGSAVALDDIVKSIKQSKYKVIEILNTMVKERIVLKYFKKGFMYKINR